MNVKKLLWIFIFYLNALKCAKSEEIAPNV